MGKKQSKFNITKFAPIIIIIAILWAYYPILQHEIVYCDDYELIIRDFDKISSFSNVKENIFSSYLNTNYYRPIINLSFLFNGALFGQNIAIYQLTNLILHLIFCLLMFKVINLFIQNKYYSLFAALFVGINPLYSNAVAWIAGRNDIILGIFVLLAIHYIIIYYKKQSNMYIFIHFISFLFALLSKESAMLMPLLFALILRYKLDFSFKSIAIKYLPYWTLAYIVVFIMKSLSNIGEPVYTIGLSEFIYNLPMLPELLSKTLFPIQVSSLATYSQFNTWFGIILLLVFATIKLKFRLYRNTNFAIGSALIALSILPAMFIRIINYYEWNDYLDCRFYLSSFGILLIMFEIYKSLNISNIITNKTTKYISTTYILILLILNVQNIDTYSNSILFYKSAVEQGSHKAEFHFVLAMAYDANNDWANYQQSISNAISNNPKRTKYYLHFGKSLIQKKNDVVNAELIFEKCLKVDSNVVEAKRGLAKVKSINNDFTGALMLLEQILQSGEVSTELYFDYAIALMQSKDIIKSLDIMQSHLNTEKDVRDYLYLYLQNRSL